MSPQTHDHTVAALQYLPTATENVMGDTSQPLHSASRGTIVILRCNILIILTTVD